MKKLAVFLVLTIFALSALTPVLARTKYDRWGHKIEMIKKVNVQAAAKVDKKEKVKEKDIVDVRGRNMGKAVRDGDSNTFNLYNQRGRKTGTYVEDENGNGKFYDVRGREIRRNRTTTRDIEVSRY